VSFKICLTYSTNWARLDLIFSLLSLSLTNDLYSAIMKPLTIGLVGPTGFTGSHFALELLNRGHNVIGISRNPSALGTHQNYKPHSIDITKASVEDIAGVFNNVDVVINAQSPSPSSIHPSQIYRNKSHAFYVLPICESIHLTKRDKKVPISNLLGKFSSHSSSPLPNVRTNNPISYQSGAPAPSNFPQHHPAGFKQR
jgi:hypothetical protein